MADDAQTLPPADHNEPTFDSLLQLATSEFHAYQTGITKPTERLYASLEAAYRMEVLGQQKPDEYKEFVKREFEKRNLGKVTKATEKSPFMRAIRLVLGSDEAQSPDRTKYSLALSATYKNLGEQGLNAKVAEYIKGFPKKVDGLATEAKKEKNELLKVKRKEQAKDKKGAEIVLAKTPKGKIAKFGEAGNEGFVLVLCHQDVNGQLSVYDEITVSGVNALLRKVFDAKAQAEKPPKEPKAPKAPKPAESASKKKVPAPT